MAKSRNWTSTLTFRRFRIKHEELSKIYWTHVLGSDSMIQLANGFDGNEYTVDSLKPSFPRNMLPIKIKYMPDWLSKYLDRIRLHLLVVASANLEAYLKTVTVLHLCATGYSSSLGKLDEIGKAIGGPILDKYTLPEPLKYAQALFKIDFGVHLTNWQEAYKYRSAMAHNGGYVTPRTLREIPALNQPLNTPIHLSWNILKDYLASADEIASLIDMKIASPDIEAIESELELKELKDAGILPPRKDIWKTLNDQFGLKVSRKYKEPIERRLYSR